MEWLPEDWTGEEAFFDRINWGDQEAMCRGNVADEYRWIVDGFDGILREHGYQRERELYRVIEPNRDTIAFFCHFGVQCVLLSHLMNISPMILWHHLCMPPSSVTTLYSEERRKGIAVLRAKLRRYFTSLFSRRGVLFRSKIL